MMKKLLLFLLVAVVMAAFVVVAGKTNVFAAPPPPSDVPGDPTTGSGDYKLGGCVSGSVLALKPGFKLNVALLEGWNSYPTEGLPPMPEYYWTLPGGPADIFTCVAILKTMEKDKELQAFPKDKGTAQVCLETPLEKEGSIYYYDQFKYLSKNPKWVKVGGPYKGGEKACVPVTNSGVYAYYAPEPDAHPKVTPETVTSLVYVRVGSVDVPTYVTSIVKPGPLALGGCVTGNVKDLPVGDKLDAELITSTDGLKPLPENVGKFYQCIADLKLYEGDKLLKELAKDQGNVTICFAIPPKHEGIIYFLDKHFDDKAEWVAVSDIFPTGIACGPVMKSGYYGMVDITKTK
jgi:hypothetical protein